MCFCLLFVPLGVSVVVDVVDVVDEVPQMRRLAGVMHDARITGAASGVS
jgi:hypothetical protein